MKNKQMEAAARLMYEACRQQHDSKKSCLGCDLYNSGHPGLLFCLACRPKMWSDIFPELKEEEE